MTISTQPFIAVNVGTTANDGSGDDLRTAFSKINDNFQWMGNTGFSAGNINVTGGINVAGTLTTNGVLNTSGAVVNTGYQKYSPTANIAVTANVDVSRIILTPTGTVVSFGANITLPNITTDGTTISISSNIAIEHLAVYGQWLSSVSPSANLSVAAGSSATYFYSSTDVKWYKIG
jgi:hypothetical protein